MFSAIQNFFTSDYNLHKLKIEGLDNKNTNIEMLTYFQNNENLLNCNLVDLQKRYKWGKLFTTVSENKLYLNDKNTYDELVKLRNSIIQNKILNIIELKIKSLPTIDEGNEDEEEEKEKETVGGKRKRKVGGKTKKGKRKVGKKSKKRGSRKR